MRNFEWSLKILQQRFQLIDSGFLQTSKHHHSLIAKQRLGLGAHNGISDCGISFIDSDRFEIVTFEHDVAVAIADEFGGEIGELRRNQARIAASNEIHRHVCILADRCSTTRKKPQTTHNNAFATPCGETRSPTTATHHTHRVAH